MRIGFDHDKYTAMQSEHILKRIAKFGGKLYLELGGKLFDDTHASRVLPGFRPDSKVAMLLNLKEQAELVVVINADDIEKNKIRGDLGITYDAEVLRLIEERHERNLHKAHVLHIPYIRARTRKWENGTNRHGGCFEVLHEDTPFLDF